MYPLCVALVVEHISSFAFTLLNMGVSKATPPTKHQEKKLVLWNSSQWAKVPNFFFSSELGKRHPSLDISHTLQEFKSWNAWVVTPGWVKNDPLASFFFYKLCPTRQLNTPLTTTESGQESQSGGRNLSFVRIFSKGRRNQVFHTAKSKECLKMFQKDSGRFSLQKTFSIL